MNTAADNVAAIAVDFPAQSTPADVLEFLLRAERAGFERALSGKQLAALHSFTPRQEKILTAICFGKTNKQIGRDLNLSEKTIKAHVTAIFRTLGVVNRTQAALVAIQKV